MKHGKSYRKAAEMVDKQKFYPLSEAVALAKKSSAVKFDAAMEVHINLNLDVKKADQVIRMPLSLPHGTGKQVRVAAFVSEGKVKECQAAGADLVGLEDLIKEVGKGKIDFDIAVAEPTVMAEIGKVAKVLGQKGLMPSPKAGTVTPDPAKVIKEIKAGRLELKTDPSGIVHGIFGKVSWDESKLYENAKAFIQAVIAAKPSGAKGTYVNSIGLASSMGPGINVDPKQL